MIEYPIKHKYTNRIQFVAEIKCEESEKDSIKKRLAFLWAMENDVNFKAEDLSSANFRGADLSYADFRGADLSYAYFRGADLSYADFRGADLSSADLAEAKLKGAILPDQYDIPVLKDIHRRLYEVCSIEDTFDMDNFCGTSKCIAGWLCTLAGEQGLNLANEIGYDAAASLIYMASDQELEVLPDYYGTNKEALTYLKRMADSRV